MALGCGGPHTAPGTDASIEESSGGEGLSLASPSSAERRAEARQRRLEVEAVEAEHLQARLAAVHSGTSYHEALLLLGIDEGNLLVRRARRGLVSVYAVAEFTLEFVYSEGEEPTLYDAVMYHESPDGREREVVARAVAAVDLLGPEVDAQIATVGEIEIRFRLAVPSEVALKICADPGCSEVLWSGLEAGQRLEVSARPTSLELSAGRYYWRVEVAGRATDARRFFLGATGPAFEPIGTEAARPLGATSGRR